MPLPREEELSKIQCPICEEDFMYKGHRDAHLKLCKRDVNKVILYYMVYTSNGLFFLIF